jgi:P-type Cu+ transporter
MARDPVCGVDVNPDEAVEFDEYQDTTFYFCSIACAEKFESDPERYAGSGQGEALDKPRKDVA